MPSLPAGERMTAKKLSLSDTRATLAAIDAAKEALNEAPSAALEYLDDRYVSHKTRLGQILDALDKAEDTTMKHLRALERQ
jgi:hypothetical protein